MGDLTVEVVTIGNELLTGKVVNTNASWIADRVTRLGGVVKRITTVSDDVDECSAAIREALSRRPKLIITTGGLGPTFDDRTLESISVALGVPLELNEEALQMVREKYSGDVTPPRLKMAKLPRGGRPLYNPVGTAPGCLIEADGTIIVALPGVPSEMRGMFEMHVEPMISRMSRAAYSFKLVKVEFIEESSLAPIIDEVMRACRSVYVKSRPKRNGEVYIEVELSSRASTKEEAEKNVLEACKLLKELIAKAGARAEEL
ncbi:MAG: nicotinamide mononucleotide deamidase-related protein [Candidatus Nezhaarchaeota archaeon]|nr:nicotinamide mononucleotide deamidase-related protein [Candidatus Nezhaarchaeota archaeon]